MRRTIISLAILKVNQDKYQKDYLDNFVPFVATLIKIKDYNEIDVNTICSDFQEEFGLTIPYHPMLILLNRAKKRGIIKQEQKTYYPNKDKIKDYDFSDKSEEQITEYDTFIGTFIDFAKDKFSIDITKDDADAAFISCLKQHDMELLFAAENNSILPEIKSSTSLNFLAYKFICNIYESRSEYFGLVKNMAIGHMLSAPLLYDNFDRFKGKLSKTNIFLDTNFIIRLLGYDGDLRKAAYNDLINVFKEHKNSLYIFQHTFEEVKGILSDALIWIDNPRYDPSKASQVLKYFRHNDYSKSDIDLEIAELEDNLDEKKIIIRAAPDPNEYQEFQINEEKLHEFITDVYKEFVPLEEIELKDFVIQRDIKSISAISKYRRGSNPSSIKDVRCIFVTTNNSLALACKKFEDSQAEYRNFIPSCVTDVFLGTIVWIQSPVKFYSLNEKKLLADCYAALQPNELLLKKYIDQLEKLKNRGEIGDEQYYLMKTNRMAMNLLQESTLGDHNNFTDRTPEEIWEEMSRSIKKEGEQKYLAEKEKRQKIQEGLNREKRKTENFNKRAEQIAHSLSIILSALLGFLFICGIVSQIFSNFPEKNWMKIIFIILTSIFGVAGFFTGFNLLGFRSKTKKFFANKISKYWLGED